MYRTKIALGIFLAIVVVGGLKFLHWKCNDGFSINNIQLHDIAHSRPWKVNPLTADERNELDAILNQEFTYLAKGHQSYVFLSADGKYVIKFLKFQRYCLNPYYAQIPLPKWLDEKREKRRQFKQAKLERLFNSWTIGYNTLKEQTGIVYLHLNQTDDLKKILRIKDKVGFTHKVDLDHVVFQLQKRTDMLGTRIEQLMSSGQVESAKKVLDHLVQMYLEQFRLGISDQDFNPLRNTGVVDLQTMAIDPGQLVWDDRVKLPEVQKVLLAKKTKQCQEWLEESYPELAEHLKGL